jgi:uncharacterized protein (TIGR00299 family) protein
MSGELFLATLLDAGLPLDMLMKTLAPLPLQGYRLKHEPAQYNGARGSSVEIILSPPVHAPHSLAESIALVQTANLPAHTQENSLAILRRFEEAHQAIASSATQGLLFSEEEALSILVCAVGVASGIATLAIDQLYASPLPLTGGFEETAQGLQPVPSPLVLEILRHAEAPWYPSSFEGERVTAIGAAILDALARFKRPVLTISGVHYAFDPALSPDKRNLRLYTGHLQTETIYESERVEDADTDWVAVIESNIDTMTGELLGGLMERLFTLGALDVSYTPLQMKKNRPASLLTVICPPEEGERFALVLLRETSTLGVRIQHVRRLKAQREQTRIETPLGAVIVKVKRLGTRVISTAPEYEECRRIAREQDIPLADVYDIVRQAIKKDIIEDKVK